MSGKASRRLAVTLVAAFVIVASFTGLMGFVSANVTKSSINQLVGEQSVASADSALNIIDLSVSNRISELREIANDSTVQNGILHPDAGRKNAESLVSTRLEERKSSYQDEVGHPVFFRILVTDGFGNKVGDTESSGPENFSERLWWTGARDSDVFLQGPKSDEFSDSEAIEISVRIDDRRGNFMGVAYALYNFEDIVRVIERSKDESQFESLEFGLFDEDGYLIHSTSEIDGKAFIGDYIPETLPYLQSELDRRFGEFERRQSEILSEYGIARPELTEAQEEVLGLRLGHLGMQYDRIFKEYDFVNPSHQKKQILDARVESLDQQYHLALREYGIARPELTESQESELESELLALESEFESVYDEFDVDFVFGGRGFAMLEAAGKKEILHSYSRHTGYDEFPGLGWTLMTHTDMNEILYDVNTQRDSLQVAVFFVTIIAGLLGVYFASVFYSQSQRLNDVERISAIGQLSSNIAHDMRNPLGTIRSSAERISDQNKDKNKHVTQEIERIKRAVNRMSHQVEGVLNYVRTTPLISDNCSIQDMLDYATDSMHIPPNVTIVMPESDCIIECDREKLEITFVNLLLNAVQAIDRQEGTIRIRLVEKRDDVILEFSNSGPPIPDGQLTRIFEPLFTSKLSGTGLGLSSCKNIIGQHSGKITAASDPVTFTILLPKKQKGDDRL